MNTSKKEDNSREHLTPEQMKLYNEGAMKADAMYKVERHMLSCELCRDALEGFATISFDESSNAIAEIRTTINEKSNINRGDKSNQKYVYWAIAASVLVLLCFGLFFQLSQNVADKNEAVAKAQELAIEEKGETKPTDSVVKPTGDLEPVAEQEQKHFYENSSPLQNKLMQNPPSARSPSPASETRSNAPVDERRDHSKSDTATSRFFNYQSARASASESEVPPLIVPDLSENDDVENNEGTKNKKAIEGTGEKETSFARSKKVRAREISGKVTTPDGEPVPGAIVIVKGTNISTNTDANGQYMLSTPTDKNNLVVSSIGHKTEEVALSNSSRRADVILNEDVATLSEVVISSNDEGKPTNANNIAPSPINGLSAYKKYLKENVTYTQAAKEKEIKGSVVVEFFVEVDGSLTEMKIKKGLGFGLDEEAIKVIKAGPEWKPGTKNGIKERQKTVVSVPFKNN